MAVRMLPDLQAPAVRALVRVMETQSKQTLIRWCVAYAERCTLPIFEAAFPGDPRPRRALEAALAWLRGEVKLPQVRPLILDAHAAAREALSQPAARAAARAAGHCAASVHSARHSLGLALYGGMAAAYAELGADAPRMRLEERAYAECARMEQALREASVEHEPHPARIRRPGAG